MQLTLLNILSVNDVNESVMEMLVHALVSKKLILCCRASYIGTA